MGSGDDFADTDARAAANFRDAADAAGVGRIVYLGGMGAGTELSAHLESRHRVGEILASGSTPTTELRAAVIIGSGSLSFEMLRYLTEVLPVMITPRWVDTRCQPIAIRDVLHYLVRRARRHRAGRSGPRHRRSRRPDLRRDDADLRRGRRACGDGSSCRFRSCRPSLSSRWVGLVTPLAVGVSRGR